MELERLKRYLQLLDDKKLVYATLVTDCHGPVRKFMRQQKNRTTHLFDVFHIAKCMYKEI